MICPSIALLMLGLSLVIFPKGRRRSPMAARKALRGENKGFGWENKEAASLRRPQVSEERPRRGGISKSNLCATLFVLFSMVAHAS